MAHEELYLKYRPKKFEQVLGQEKIISTLSKMIERKKVPHAILFVGPSGCGKTTLARIVANRLGAKDKHDLQEINCATLEKPMEEVRSIQSKMYLSAIRGARVWIFDEVQSLSRASFAQQGLLKILEEPPRHSYFMLCTTDPSKIIAPVQNRCTKLSVKLLDDDMLTSLVKQVIKKEETKVYSEVVEKIVEVSLGSARRALVLLEQAMQEKGRQAQLDSIQSRDVEQQAIDIARALINSTTKWREMAGILREVNEDPEQIRYLVLAYADKVLLSAGKATPRAALVIEAFETNFYDGKKASLDNACYSVIHGR